jgi:hypothetical protein
VLQRLAQDLVGVAGNDAYGLNFDLDVKARPRRDASTKLQYRESCPPDGYDETTAITVCPC